MSRMSRQAGLLSTVDMFRFGIKTLIGIALARILTKEDYGSYRQLFLIYTTFSTLLLLGIPQSLMYFIPKAADETEQRRIISRTLNLISVLALVFMLGLYLLRHPIANLMNNPGLADLLVLFAIYPVFMFVTQMFNSTMLSLKRPQSMARFTLFSILCDLVLILSIALVTKDLRYIVVGVLVSAFLQWIYARINLGRFAVGTDWKEIKGLRQQLGYSLPLGLASIIGLLAVQLDKFVISGYFSTEQFAIFAIGAMELPFISILTNSVNSIILPHISSGKNIAEAVEIYRASVRKNALIIFPLAAIFVLFASPIIRILYTAGYIESVPYFRVYLLTVPLRAATFGIIFLAFNHTRTILINALFTMILNLILNLVLVRYLGMMGPALSTVLVTYLSAAFYILAIRYKLQIDPRSLFPVNALIRTGVAMLIAGLLCLPFLYLTMNDYLKLVLGVVMFGTLYLLLCTVFRAILPYDRQFIMSLFRRRSGDQ